MQQDSEGNERSISAFVQFSLFNVFQHADKIYRYPNISSQIKKLDKTTLARSKQ